MKTLAFVLAFFASAASAEAANPGYCHHYADLAVFQFHKAESIPGCYHGATTRWNDDWDAHYEWCLGADYYETRAEDDVRGHRLRECAMEAY